MSEIFGYYLPRFFNWVINTTIMASILVVLILAVKILLRNRLTPRWHYLLWMILIVRLLLPWAPGSSYSIYSILSNGHVNTISVQYKPDNSINNKLNQEPTNIPDNLASKQDQKEISNIPHTIKETNPNTINSEVVRNKKQPNQQNKHNKPISLNTIALYIWLTGILVISFISYRENRRLYSLIKKQPMITDKRIVEMFENCKKAMSIRKMITILSFDKLSSPTVLGFLRPRVLLSKQLINQLTDSQLRHIFYHELAHVKRKDVAFNWLMYCLLILNWFNPILWLAYFCMREDQELACDAYALSYLDDEEKIPYGLTIINLLEHYSNFYQVPSLANLSRNKGTLKRRIFMIKTFQKKSYRWSALGFITVLAVSSLTLLNAHADGSNGKQIKQTTEKVSKNENKKEQTVYIPPIQKESFKVMTKEEVLTKMLNTVDYFKTAKGEFKIHYGNIDGPISYSIIDYELSLKNNYNAGGYSKTTGVVNGKETLRYNYYRDGEMWDLNPETATYTEAGYLTGEKQGTLKIQDAFPQTDVTNYRERPPIGQAMSSLFPYEIASNYTRNLDTWEIEKQNEELLGHNMLVIKGKINKIVNKSFRFWVDKDTGILVKYETYDASGKVNDYLYPTKLEINVPIDRNDFVPKSLDAYKKFDKSLIKKGPILETGNIDNEIPKELKTQWDEAKKKPNETTILNQNDIWYISVKRGYLADYIEVNGKEGTLFLAKTSRQKSQFIFHALAKGYKVDTLKIKYE
ncbi:M56 family metallopeptidase [Neobacillus sp. PS3-12]|uniref:M56 family metallopeptidase n=1 Tax=Neobacillus sp. PS3-12 TaxID=3070677 RepID=UPI0027E21261|nr:M56 family metallopeptidase [Neobacillus sp. PS3-12]WML52212.1 M56 family metallopeptidase [Neobacillus sp. PS3-12]